MLKRKIETLLLRWKKRIDHKPLVIKGIRQCGKTFIVQKFAREHYQHVVYVNFILRPELAAAFAGSKDVDTIVLNLTALLPEAKFERGRNCLILDEIQDCPDARTALKSFKEHGGFDVIATGSLLGVKGYGGQLKKAQDPQFGKNSIPVGSETVITMYSLDFEEFLWANGISGQTIAAVKRCFKEERPVPEGVHQAFRTLWYRYVAIGGLPEAVNAYLEHHSMSEVLKVYASIIDEYEDDMVKYAADESKARIRECFGAIPVQLAKENKKFQYSVIKKGARSSQYAGSLQWLEDAGIITRCYNVHQPQLPLSGNRKDDVFKVYPADIGLLTAMLGQGAAADILQGRMFGYKGAIFEGAMADVLHKKGQKLYCYQKDSGLTLDFLIRQQGECVPCEVKATSGKAKSLKTVLRHPETYQIRHALKFGDYNVGRDGAVLTLPAYMAAFLDFTDDEDLALPPLDAESVNRRLAEDMKA